VVQVIGPILGCGARKLNAFRLGRRFVQLSRAFAGKVDRSDSVHGQMSLSLPMRHFAPESVTFGGGGSRHGFYEADREQAGKRRCQLIASS
jgi:hypothetical protein